MLQGWGLFAEEVVWGFLWQKQGKHSRAFVFCRGRGYESQPSLVPRQASPLGRNIPGFPRSLGIAGVSPPPALPAFLLEREKPQMCQWGNPRAYFQ